jgi:hypothetical protein
MTKISMIPRLSDGLQLESMDGELVLFHPTSNLLAHANPTAAIILKLCDGKRSVDEIVTLLSDAYPDAAVEIARDVPETIGLLIDQGVLQTT